MDTNTAPPLNLKPADDEGQPKPEAAEAAKQAEAAKPARRARRGPPADGKPENRVTMVLTTSKLSDPNGERLRRGRPVSVPERRVESLTNQGRIRKASAEEIEVLTRRYGLAQLG